MKVYYNEFEPYAAQWLRNLIAQGLIPAGDVDERSIVDVRASDLLGYGQAHFFAGIGGWAYALRLAGWEGPVWTGSCPCQPFSVAGKGKAQSDERHLWPHWFRLIAAERPSVVFGEQVAGAIAHGWLDDAFDDLEREGYETGACVLTACSVGAPHKRDRLWFVADASLCGRRQRNPNDGRAYQEPCALQERGGFTDGSEVMANAHDTRPQGRDSAELPERAGEQSLGASGSFLENPDSGRLCRQGVCEEQPRGTEAIGASEDGSAHSGWEFEPGVGRVAHGVPARVGRLRAYGNAIVPQVAAEFIKATMSYRP